MDNNWNGRNQMQSHMVSEGTEQQKTAEYTSFWQFEQKYGL